MLGDNDRLHKENEELKNMNYDLRYELQEIGIELNQQKQTAERDLQDMKKQIEEAKTKQKIELKPSQRVVTDNYADMSVNKSVVTPG